MEDRDARSRVSQLAIVTETRDDRTGDRVGRIALRSQHDGDRRRLGEGWCVHQRTSGCLAEHLEEVTGDPGQHHLGLGIAEAHVELDHLGALRGQHEPGVEQSSVVDPMSAERRERGVDGDVHQLVDLD